MCQPKSKEIEIESDASALAWIVLIFFLSASIIQLAWGAAEAHNTGSCSYSSIADYGPGRMLGCFLFEKRW